MIDYKRWKKRIYLAIQDIADKAYQEDTWLGKNKNQVSSFTEVICVLFDDLCFSDNFWEQKHIIHFNFSQNLLSQMQLLKKIIDDYQEKQTDKEILEDPEWQKIRDQAKKVIELWDQENKH